MNPIKITVPATTANLGAGFDCLGLALGLYNTVRFEAVGSALEIEIEGEGAAELPRDESNLIARAAQRVFDLAGRRPDGLRIRAVNGIPLGSGLGSSAAATLGGLAAANALADAGLSASDLLRLATEIEGHPDNAAAALHGGLTLVSASEGNLLVRRCEPAEMRAVVVLPSVRLSTAEARAALPAQVPLNDAVFNIGRAALTVKAIETGDWDLLGSAMGDRLHQPYRRRLIPGYDAAERAAHEAGAMAVALSGAGPSLIAFAAEGHEAIAGAMSRAFADAGHPARSYVLPIDRQGLHMLPNGD